ncbi:MAG: YdcF family protein [Candidatus Deferrimicrobium sp.]
MAVARPVFVSAAILAVIALALWSAPGFLTFAQPPRASDAVVLFSGPGQEARLREAKELIVEGYAKLLILPAHGSPFRLSGESLDLERVAPAPLLRDRTIRIRKAAFYAKHYENTHVEALEAKRMMNELGLRSAILVSSPYHTRRLGLIARKVFDRGRYEVTIAPSRYQASFRGRDWFSPADRGVIVGEYVKMAWFVMYAPFC